MSLDDTLVVAFATSLLSRRVSRVKTRKYENETSRKRYDAADDDDDVLKNSFR